MPEYICTMGPSINNKEKIIELYHLGLSTVRFNASHIDYDVAEVMNMLKEAEASVGGKIQTLFDTCGPEVRVKLSKPRQVEKGDILVLGEDFDLTASYTDILEEGDILQIDDGKLSLKVISKLGDFLYCQSESSGKLKNKAGVNSPKMLSSLPFMSEKDKTDLQFAFANNLDWVALSFVCSKEDIMEAVWLKSWYPACKTKIMAKIETAEALANLGEIIALCDGIMIARGDLGVSLPISMLASAQNYIAYKTLSCGKKLVAATGFLRSMKNKPMPERAEVLDLYYTFLNNTTSIVFSGETAIADDPANILKMANAIYDSLSLTMQMNYAPGDIEPTR